MAKCSTDIDSNPWPHTRELDGRRGNPPPSRLPALVGYAMCWMHTLGERKEGEKCNINSARPGSMSSWEEGNKKGRNRDSGIRNPALGNARKTGSKTWERCEERNSNNTYTYLVKHLVFHIYIWRYAPRFPSTSCPTHRRSPLPNIERRLTNLVPRRHKPVPVPEHAHAHVPPPTNFRKTRLPPNVPMRSTREIKLYQ